MSSTALDAKEVLAAIQRGLPNIATYLRTVLKREKLSEEAELRRARYEAILTSLEQGVFPSFGRKQSFSNEDDGGYFSGNRTRISEIHDQPRVPSLSHSGYLLRRDDKYRWHRSWCRLESRDMKFSIFEDNNEEVLVKSFSVENTSPRFGSGTIPDCDKENCFAITGITSSVGDHPATTSVAMTPEGETAPPLTATSPQMSDEIYFAAYSDADLRQWKEALHLLTSSRESGRISLNILEGGSWLSPAAHDSASTSSSNFSSNRESMISTTSSLWANTNRMSARSDTLDREQSIPDEFKAMSLTKQQQPLPSPPPLHGQEDSVKPEDDDDNASNGTIYESIDNLVLQFDEQMRETAQAMGQLGQSMKPSGKKRKKKDRSLFRQHSFLSSRKNSKARLISEKKAELEKGERFCGHLFKKSSSGSWKKKWCVLKGSIFGYHKSSESDSHGQEYVILGADIQTYEDSKRSFTFCVTCKGVPEMFFSAEDEGTLLEWLSKLAAASADTEKTGFGEEWAALQDEQAMADDTKQHGNSVYRVPRPISMDGSVYDIPPARVGPPAPPLPPGISAEAAIESGIYSVPRALLNANEEGAQQLPPPPPNPFDIYDIPRASISPDMEDEEGIYDVPLDILDFEIYDYPPDVMELAGYDPGDSGLDTTRNSTVTMSSDYTLTERASSTISEDSWSTYSHPYGTGMRPSMALSTFSMASSDDLQSPRNSVISTDTTMYNYSRSNVSSEYYPSPIPPPNENGREREMLSQGTMTPDIDQQVAPLVSGGGSSIDPALEYAQCQMKGNLFKRERFMTWTKHYCIIRNNFLECHKSSGDHYTPSLKLFLPGSEIKEGGSDTKKKWAFQVKHPRRDGVLTFATDSHENLERWIKAFQIGSSIEVQSVHTVDQIRITDLDMQKKWVSLEANALIDHNPSTPSSMMEDFSTSTMPRRKTFSHQDEYQSDTLKRRRKFSWVKSGLMRRKGKKAPGSQGDLEQNRLSQMSFDVQGPTPDMLPQYPPDPMRKSVSLELLPSPPEGEELQNRTAESHESITDEGKERFQGYLRVQRKGADNVWVLYWCVLEEKTISCYISRKDCTLALSIPLKGSRITETTLESKREHSFKVWHIESGQCLFFAAENSAELQKWFNHVTHGAEHTIPDNVSVGSNSGPFVGFFYIPNDKKMADHSNSASHLNELAVGGSHEGQPGPAITVQCPTPTSSVFYRGELKKLAHTGKWKDRYCVIRTGSLNIFHHSTEKSPITSIALRGCSLELISVPTDSEHHFIFKLNPMGGSKSHTFAAPNETEMFAWVSALRDSAHEHQSVPELKSQVSAENGTGSGGSSTSSPALSGKNTLKRKSKKLKDANLVSYVPASSLKNSEHSGYIEIQFASEPWMQYWCVSHTDNCLYIYEDQASEATVKTICLPGYELKVIDPQVSKRPYTISINHPGISPVLLAANDQTDLNMWLFVLERGTKAELSSKSPKKVASTSKVLLNDTTNVKVLSHKVTSKSSTTKKKGPMKADHNIGKVKATEEGSGSAESSPPSSGKPENPQAQQDAIVKRYEKRIRKTRKVANQTEESLKQHQAALLHFKKELSRHIVKLIELANGGDHQATKRLKSIRVKLQQVDKIVPYLGKYIAVNRQAEMQTVSVLKESCTMELRKMSKSPAKEGLKASPRGHRGTSPLSKSLKTEGIKEEENENGEQQDETADPQPPPAAATTAESAKRERGEVTVESDSREESSSSVGDSVSAASSVVVISEENPYASLSEIRPQMEAEQKMPLSNYAQLHFDPNTGCAKVRPPSVNYSEVKIFSSGKGMILTPDSVDQTYKEDKKMDQQHPTIIEEEPQDHRSLGNHVDGAEADQSLQDTTLTPESAALEVQSLATPKPPLTPKRSVSPGPPPSHPPPPPPPSEDSPLHKPCSHTPPVSPIAHGGDSRNNKENGELDTSVVASSPIAVPGQSTPVDSGAASRRAEAKAKSPPPPVAKKPTSKQSTPVHKANHSSPPSSTSSPAHNGLEGSAETAISSELSLSPTHRDMVSVMEAAPSVMDRIKALHRK